MALTLRRARHKYRYEVRGPRFQSWRGWRLSLAQPWSLCLFVCMALTLRRAHHKYRYELLVL